MSEPENIPILRRKIKALNVLSEIGGRHAQKALRQAFARAAQDSMGLEVVATGCAETRLSVDDIIGGLAETHLLMLLKGPEAVHGLAVVDFQMVAAVVEYQTTGRVVPDAAVAREATRTDAMMISELLDAALAIFDAELAQMPDAPPASGFRTMVVLKDARAVSMALEEVPFRQFSLALDVGRGAKIGEIGLYFPHDPPRKENFRSQEIKDWQGQWQGHVMQLQAPIEAIIHRVSMSLEDVKALEVGSLIPVPAAQISAISLEGVDGRSVAIGKLGQVSGNRAIRISTRIGNEKPVEMPVPEVMREIETVQLETSTTVAAETMPENPSAGPSETTAAGAAIDAGSEVPQTA